MFEKTWKPLKHNLTFTWYHERKAYLGSTVHAEHGAGDVASGGADVDDDTSSLVAHARHDYLAHGQHGGYVTLDDVMVHFAMVRQCQEVVRVGVTEPHIVD